MRVLDQGDFLALWEGGESLHPLDRGLLAIHAAFPETQRDSVADWPIGRRNRALAQVRCAYFGPLLRGWTPCRKCGDHLEFELDARALAEGDVPEQAEPIVVNGVAFRLPTSRDLARIAARDDPGEAAVILLEHCRIDGPAQTDVRAAHIAWSADDLDAIGDRLALADPLAEILLHFDCPACGEAFQESLDLSAFLWTEMEGRARRLLHEVHVLASAYGWSEAEILALSAARRAVYLEMVHA